MSKLEKKQEQELKKEKELYRKEKELHRKEKENADKFKETTIINLLKQKMTIEQIASILNISLKEVEKISKKTSK